VIKIALFGNFTGIEFLDIMRQLVESEVIGTTELAALFVFLLAVIALLMTDARKEAVALVPLPIAVAFASSVGITWLSVVIYMLAGAWLGMILISLFRIEK
jgi:hypothetical protein